MLSAFKQLVDLTVNSSSSIDLRSSGSKSFCSFLASCSAIASKSTKAASCCCIIVAECSIAIFASIVPSVSNSSINLSKSVLFSNLAFSTE